MLFWNKLIEYKEIPEKIPEFPEIWHKSPEIPELSKWLGIAISSRVKNRKNRVPASSDEGLWQKRQVLGNNFGCVWWI